MEAIAFSILLGFVVATIGAWKDTQWEPFSLRTYFRSPIISGIWSIPLFFYFKESPAILIALSAISMERLTIESWKGLLRKMPSKFKSENRDTQWVRAKTKNFRKLS